MDSIYMSVGNTNRCISSVIDSFSCILWTRKNFNRTAQTIVNNLQNIVESNYPTESNEAY